MSNNFGNNSFNPSDIEDLLECVYGLSGSGGEGSGDAFEGYAGFTIPELYPEEFEFLSENPNFTGLLIGLCTGMDNEEVTECLLHNLLSSAMEMDGEKLNSLIQAINFFSESNVPADEICSVFDSECLSSDNILECAIIKITDNLDECGILDFVWCNDLENSPDGICPESFNFIPVGTTYTCDIAGISFKYTGAINRTIYVGDLCITIPKRDYFENFISSSEAAELMSAAWDEAQALTAQEFAASGHTMTSVAYKNLFISNLKIIMINYFDGTFGSGTMNVVNQKCSGSFPTSRPKYSFWC
ncbi:MAG: hypothetical protein KDC56_12975 [Flavobacteriaceae bacterium]|nr:hypothetical protein [Flavobacteriaceae bacterium]